MNKYRRYLEEKVLGVKIDEFVVPPIDPTKDKALSFILAGLKMLRAKANEVLTIVDIRTIRRKVKEHIPYVHVISFDEKFAIGSKNAIMNEDRYDITTWRRYIPDLWDCDNYAFMFKTWMAFVYGYTGIAVALGFVFTPDGEFLHAFNVIVCKDGVLLYEPQLHTFVDINKETETPIPLTIDDVTLEYYPITLLFF